ncbi:hypothetical protein ABCS02_21915 [Microbacterium sp. X-17]|uniref:hypothetical protein n=1 Tax=Microbacterium sp. X-17 TaxID=3144404 RepID=UPI0031F4C2B7
MAMASDGRRGVLAVATVVVLLALGAVMAFAISNAVVGAGPEMGATSAGAVSPTSYRTMIARYDEWHDTSTEAAYEAWAQARDAFVAEVDVYRATGEGDIVQPGFDLAAAQLGVERADRDLAMAWIARVLLLLAIAWLLIGMLSARTRLVRRPGAAAARATWIGSTRPWRARESTLGFLPLDRWLVLVVPAALLVATRAVQTSFLSWMHLVIVVGAWVLFALVVRFVVGRRSPWPVIATVGGVVVLRCIVTLFALSFTGPGGFWYAFWTDPARRDLYVALAVALFLWAFVAAGWALGTQIGPRRGTGAVLAGVGAGLAVPAAVVGAIGFPQALTLWNAQVGLLPQAPPRILDVARNLGIPDSAAWYAAVLGLLLLVVGLALALPRRRPTSLSL